MTRHQYETKATAHRELTVLRREFQSLMGQANTQARCGNTTEARRLQREAKALQPRINRLYRASM